MTRSSAANRPTAPRANYHLREAKARYEPVSRSKFKTPIISKRATTRFEDRQVKQVSIGRREPNRDTKLSCFFAILNSPTPNAYATTNNRQRLEILHRRAQDPHEQCKTHDCKGFKGVAFALFNTEPLAARAGDSFAFPSIQWVQWQQQ